MLLVMFNLQATSVSATVQDIQDCGGYQTVGVDMVVTGERIILLDTQVSNVCMYVCVHMCIC